MNDIATSRNKNGNDREQTAVLIERLRASKMASTKSEQEQGFASGREWATDFAEYKDLLNLSKWWETTSPGDRELALTTLETDPFNASHHLACITLGLENSSRHDSDEFWDAAIGEDDERRHSDDFVLGFVEGALEVWDSVRDQI